MSFHFCSHAWEVRDVEDGTVVRLRNRDLSAEMVPILVNELFVLVQESGRPNLYLDLADIGLMSGSAMDELVVLNTTVREHGGRLVLRNVQSGLRQRLDAEQLVGVLDLDGATERASMR